MNLRAADGPLKRGDRILDKYEVRGLLGKGGHAFVYDCFNSFLAEEVAIKLIPNQEHHGDQLLKRARGEAQVLYRLNHPNVVRVMDGGEFNGMAYIVMEKLDGTSLRHLLRTRGPLPVPEALLIALQVAEALEAAHAMNVIHRDLKPDNIFLLAENRVKVLDFGIAKFLGNGYQTTQKDVIQGTAPYMSPEHAQGLGVTFASDIFQLGTIMYEMIAGVCPCMIGIEEVTLQELVAIQISKLPPRLKLIVRGVPDYVDRLIWRAIAKQAQQRFATMREFKEAIRSALDRLNVDLPRERAHRSVAVREASSRPPELHGVPNSGVVKTTPIALVTPTAGRHSSVPPAATTDPMPHGSPLGVPREQRIDRALEVPHLRAENRPKPSRASARQVRPRSTHAAPSARVMLTRAVLLGALAAVPIGLVFGLALRRAAPRGATSTERLAQPIAHPANPALPLTDPSNADDEHRKDADRELSSTPGGAANVLPPPTPSVAASVPRLIVKTTPRASATPRPVAADPVSGLDQAASQETAAPALTPATATTARVVRKAIF